MSLFAAIRSPAQVIVGNGQRAALPSLAASFGRRAFICTDNRFHVDEKLSQLAHDLRAEGIEPFVYDGTVAELPMQCIDEATAAAKTFGPDLVIAIGGGSCVDLAKVVALRLAHEGPISGFYGEFKVPGPVLPIIALPTTAGTGSEVTPVAVVGDPERSVKVGISSPYLIPHVAICDPELTLTCPPGLTASSGADALCHAIEAFTAISRPADAGITLRQVFVGRNGFSDVQARAAIELLFTNLARAVSDGSNIAARENVMLGATLAGQAFGVAGTAAAHAIQYPAGALTHTAHGVGVACLLPYVMAFNSAQDPTRFAAIADLLAVGVGEDNAGKAKAAIDAIAQLFAAIGIPATLKDLGLEADKLDWVAEQSLEAKRLVNNNPRTLDITAMKALVAAAYSGNRDALCSL